MAKVFSKPGGSALSWGDAVQPALRMLLQPEARLDPYLEMLRLGAEHEDIEARDIVVILALGGALVTGTLVSTDTWERLHLRQLGDHDDILRRVVRHAIGHLDEAAEKRRRPREIDNRFLHLRDVTYRSGRTSYALPAWRGPISAVSGWTLGEPDED
ncbi:hypothetical protein ACFYXM_36960 [Streptomyces sp. NPDC002476]|uniref:hypothetical protein n=1 Tax=Streptomyces sp. NPDC002476 TaxID=3364648 RepID=UPI0036ABA6DE